VDRCPFWGSTPSVGLQTPKPPKISSGWSWASRTGSKYTRRRCCDSGHLCYLVLRPEESAFFLVSVSIWTSQDSRDPTTTVAERQYLRIF
jgi:hypothetical protein